MKRLFCVLLTLALLASFAPLYAAADAAEPVLRCNPYGGAADAIDTVTAFTQADTLFLFLPADAAPENAVFYVPDGAAVAVNGAPIVNGEPCAAIAAAGAYTLTYGGEVVPLRVMRSASIPAVFIETESGSLDYIHADKENKEPASIRVYENGVMTLDGALKHIKGRGNATWTYPKKPYNIKFDKKTALLGMPKAKKWTLLASDIDLSLLRNPRAWELAGRMGLPYTSEYRHADLYLNGDYVGNYIFCESVEIGENRVEIADLEKANETANPGVEIESLPQRGNGANGAVEDSLVKGARKWFELPAEPENVTGGYLLEFECRGRYEPESSGFVTYNGQPVVIKSPEYASFAEVAYIADFVDEASEALYADSGYNARGKHYTEYYDTESLVDSYILQELSMNYDAARSSFFAYKDAGADGKLIFAPIWDMDNTFGRATSKFGTSRNDTSLWWANMLGCVVPTVLSAAYQHADFRAAVARRWAEIRAGGVIEAADEAVSALSQTLAASAVMNAVRWNYCDSADAEVCLARYEQAVGLGADFTAARTAALDVGFGPDGAWLSYDINGADADEYAFFTRVQTIGDEVRLRAFTGNGAVTPPEGTVFVGWNTKRDGSGAMLQPGETLTLREPATILYAIYRPQEQSGEPEEPQKQRGFWQRFLDFFRRIVRFFRSLFGG